MNLQDQTKNAAYVNSKNEYGDTMLAVPCTKGFIAGAEWERQRDKWISVKEQLPPKEKTSRFSDDVLVSDGKRISTGFYEYNQNNPDNNYWYASPISGYDVKFWQPLPEPPKEK